MDQAAFDRIARLLGGASTRRQGIAAALGGMLGLAAVTTERDAAVAAPASRGHKRRPRPEGPCGDGTRKDNICTRNADCCTNICNLELGKKNVDRKGRCRCMRRGQPCKADRNCCNTLTCNGEVCGEAVVCTVCASGCPYTTVEAAYAAAAPGSVILIDAGTYPTQILVDKNITLEACGDADPVLTPSRESLIDSYYVVMAEDSSSTTPRSITLSGLTFTGTGAQQEWLLYAEAAGNIAWNIRNCTFSTADIGLHTAGTGHVIENSTFTKCGAGLWFSGFDVSDSLTATGCTFSDCTGSGFVVDSATATLTNCTVTGNQDSGCGVYDGNFTLANTSVTGNSSTSWGGGVFAQAGYDSGNTTVTFSGTTLVTGNTAPEASGIGVVNNGVFTTTVIGASSANVKNNLTGDQCEISTDAVNWTPVANCAY